MDFLTIFIGYTQDGSTRLPPTPLPVKEGNHIKVSKAIGATPVWYGYVIAEGAKLKLGVEDCNNGGGLCSVGAKYIKENEDVILAQYKSYAEFAAKNWGTTKPFYFMLEPDFYQYTQSSQNNPLSYTEAKKILTDIVTTIKSALPNAVIGMDISPWASGNWWSSAIPYDQFQFMGTSGGVASPGGTIKDGLAWSTLYNTSKLGMMADDGYGVGGAIDQPDAGWLSESNLKSRISDGVFAYWMATGDASYGTSVASLKQKLASEKLKTCVEQKLFTLTMNPGTGGSISASPAAASYASGSSVKLTAAPAAGYRFASWGGAASGTANPTTITIDANKTVSATFVSENAPVTLTIGTAANGTVSVSPVMPAGGYTRGTAVTLTATPSTGYQFVSWSGGASGNVNPLALTMNADLDISPIFRKIGEVTNLIKGGDGASTTNWTAVSNPSGATLTTAADPKNSGNTVLSTKGNYGEKSGEEAFMVTQGGIQVTAGTTYFLSFRAMVSSPDDTRGAHPLGVKFENGSTTAFKVSDSVKQDTSWHLYSYSFKATATGTATLSFLLGNGGDRNWQSVLIDDVILSDVPPVAVVARNVVRRLAMKVVGSSLDLAIVAEQGDLRIDAVSPSGEVRNLVDRRVEAGSFRVAVPVSDLRNGVYTLRIRNGNSLRTGAFSVVK